MKANKILVVGAGVAGTAATYWLKKFGFEPYLIEKSATMRIGGQPLDIRGVAIEIVKKMGIYEKICQLRTQVAHGRYVDDLGNIIHEEMGETAGFRQGEDVEILRGDLLEIMNSTNTCCHYGQEIKNIQLENDCVKIDFKNGQQKHFDLVIGADGIHSQVRSLVFGKNDPQLINLGVYLSIFEIPNYLNLSHAEMWCEKNQSMVTLISDKNPNTAHAAFMFRSNKSLKNPRDEKEQRQFIRDYFKDFGWEVPNILNLLTDKNDFYFDMCSQVKMARWHKGRVALLGDAGFCASPLSGQGNNLALVGAYILAGELKKAQGDHVLAFNRYEEILRPFVKANQDFGAWVSESFLCEGEVSKEVAEIRSQHIMQRMKTVSSAIDLPDYEND